MRFLRSFKDMGNAMQNYLLNDSGSNGRKAVQVQVLLPAPKHSNPNLLPIGETFGFVVFLNDNT